MASAIPAPTDSLPKRAPKVATTVCHADESITVTIDDTSYDFHAPRGRDLSKMRSAITSGMDEVEMLACVMDVLQQGDKLTATQWLDDVDLFTFQKVGEAINSYFQL